MKIFIVLYTVALLVYIISIYRQYQYLSNKQIRRKALIVGVLTMVQVSIVITFYYKPEMFLNIFKTNDKNKSVPINSNMAFHFSSSIEAGSEIFEKDIISPDQAAEEQVYIFSLIA